MPAVISGCGVVSPLGDDVAAFEAALLAGTGAVQAETLVLPGAPPSEVPVARAAFDASETAAPSRVPADRGTAMALSAAEAAMAQAGLVPGTFDAERMGLYWGSGMAGAASFDAACKALYTDQRRIRPTTVVTTMPNAPVAELALRFGVRGFAVGYAAACASAAVALGEALRALQRGDLDVVLCGGSEALLSPAVMGAWQAMRVLAPASPGGVQPFGARRSGFALGEGAAAFVLETEAHARARGVQPSLLLSGYGTSCDAVHITQPDPAGQARALNAALRSAGLSTADIGHVNSHGTATLAGDAAEAASLARVFGADIPPVTATKAAVGHLLGAGGAVELLATLAALRHGAAPPTAGVEGADPQLGLDLVVRSARPLPGLRHALSSSFAFGGTNAVLVVSRC